MSEFKTIFDKGKPPQVMAFYVNDAADWDKIVEVLLVERIHWGMIEIRAPRQTVYLYYFPFCGDYALSKTKFSRLPTHEKIWYDGGIDAEGLRVDFDKLMS